MKTKLVLMAALVMFLGVFCAGSAMADPIQLSCPSCTSGASTLISPGGTVSFSFVAVNSHTYTGDGFLYIVVPSGGTVPTFSGGAAEAPGGLSFTTGDLATLFSDSISSANLSNFNSFAQQVGLCSSACTFTAYEYDLGSITLGPSGAGVSGLSVTAPVGSTIFGTLEETGGTTLQTPWSESITVPEPSTWMLIGIGLAGLLFGAGVLRQRPA